MKFKMLAQLEIQGLLSVLDEDTNSVSDERKLEEGTVVKKDPKKFEKIYGLGVCSSVHA
ncbi:hypothetical protein Bca4012_076944 [Brassica carinata]